MIGQCKKCGNKIGTFNLANGVCKSCYTENTEILLSPTEKDQWSLNPFFRILALLLAIIVVYGLFTKPEGFNITEDIGGFLAGMTMIVVLVPSVIFGKLPKWMRFSTNLKTSSKTNRFISFLFYIFIFGMLINRCGNNSDTLHIIPQEWTEFTESISQKYDGVVVDFYFTDDLKKLDIYIIGSGLLKDKESDVFSMIFSIFRSIIFNSDTDNFESFDPISEELNKLSQWTIDFINTNKLDSNLINRGTEHITFGFKSSLSDSSLAYSITINILPIGLGDAETTTLSDSTILDYGIYEKKFVDNTNSPMDSSNIVFELSGNHTDLIPAKINTTFGFRYVLNGKPKGAIVKIRTTYTFPTMTNPITGKVRTRKESWELEPIGTKQLGRFWAFTEPWEVLPGKWTISLYDDQRLLIEKTFTVIETQK